MVWILPRMLAGLVALVFGTAIGYFFGEQLHLPLLASLLGAAAAAGVMALRDTVHGVRLLNWLRRSLDGPPPRDSGLWGELAHRIERLVRLREAETAAERRRLDQFFEAIEASPNGVMILDGLDHIVWFSTVAAAHFGLQPERDLQQRITNLVRSPIFVAYLQSRAYDQPVKMPSPSGDGVLQVVVRVFGEGMKLVLSMDVTERERNEVMRRDFVANVSHEIRTPLTVVAGFIETLANLPLTEVERKRVLTLMAQQTGRMQALVSDLLTLARLEGSPRPPLDTWVPAAKLLAVAETDARSLSQGRHTLRFTPPDHPDVAAAQIAGAETELLSALGNLVNNAVRYTPEGGSITVTWDVHPDGEGRFIVVDTGPGIEPEHLPRLTERFYRVDSSRSRDTGGTGLGLSIVKHVAQRHGGELRVESQLGKGSSFTLAFPAARVRLGSAHDGRPGVPAVASQA
ncbi:MAG: phosphate regulon sensor histidine kinase PhoR [Burkholderiales bacterium]|nr:phosphate regulon sensor histidine kinase PhoR [Burkholderiales bacterium]